MKTLDEKYTIYPDCALDVETGETIAVWHPVTHEPHPAYPKTADFLVQYSKEIFAEEGKPQPEPKAEA